MCDHFGEQRVEVGVGGVARVAERLHANARSGGRLERSQDTGRRPQAAVRLHVFHVDPCLDRIAARARDGCLLEPELRERLASGDAQLRLHQVRAGHLLRDGVFHLQTRVGLDKGEVPL